MRVVRTLLAGFLLWLATSAWASPFPINFPELHASDIQITPSLISGNIDSVTDYGLCSAGCHFSGGFSVDTTLLFQIYGTSPSDLYLSGQVVGASIDDPNDLSLFITVLFDNQQKWNQVEGQTASPFGNLLAFNIHNADLGGTSGGGDDSGDDDHEHEHETYGDIGPCANTQTPEPASCVLVIGGIAAGLLRRRLVA